MSTFWTIVTAILAAEAILMVVNVAVDLVADRINRSRINAILAEWADDDCDCDYDEPVKKTRKRK